MPKKDEAPSLILLSNKGFSVLVGRPTGSEEPYMTKLVFRDCGGRGGKGEVRNGVGSVEVERGTGFWKTMKVSPA